MHNIWRLIIAIGLSLSAGAIGSIFTMPAIPGWYAVLQKPDLSPPDWLFGPVWTMLYILMGVAAFIIWKRGLDKKEVKIALVIFGIQLALNVLWSVMFFGLQDPGLALIEIIVLWLAILFTIIVFYRISRVAAFLLLPYILWVSFASYLNYAIWMLN